MPDTPPKTLRPEDRFSIRMLRVVNTAFARVYHHLDVVSPSNLPPAGGGILVCNHISPIDPILIQSACRDRLISWMMAKEYMQIPLMGRVFRALDVIPVDRGSRETGPFRSALRQLKAGRIVGIFPEGKISTTNDLLDFQTGAALLASRAGVPIFPVYLDGSQRNKTMTRAFFQRSASRIAFGPPLALTVGGDAPADTPKEILEQYTAQIRAAVEKLRIVVDARGNKLYL